MKKLNAPRVAVGSGGFWRLADCVWPRDSLYQRHDHHERFGDVNCEGDVERPSSGAYIGAWSAGGTTLSETVPLATYEVDAIATSVSTGALDCTSSDLQSTSSALSGAGSFNVSVSLIALASCQ